MSTNINEFKNYLAKQKRFIGEARDFVWVTEDPDIIKSINEYCPEIEFITGITPIKQKLEFPPHELEIIDITEVPKNIPTMKKRYGLVTAGGISAKILSIFSVESNISPILFVEHQLGFMNSTYGSSWQYHVSHAMPMYTDPEFSTLNIIYKTICRNFLKCPENPEQDNYLIVEIFPKAFLCSKTIKVGFGYFANELKYKFNKLLGKETIIDETVPFAVLSGKILDNFIKYHKLALTYRLDTVRLAYNKKETKEFFGLKSDLQKHGIETRILSPEEYKKQVGIDSPNIVSGGTIWRFPGDGVLPKKLFEYFDEFLQKAKSYQFGLITKVVVENNEFFGVVIRKEDNKEYLLRSEKTLLSLGASVSFKKSRKVTYLEKPETVIEGSGFSSYLLIEGHVKAPIDSNNSHFSPIKKVKFKNKLFTIVKASSGATVGYKGFCKDHALNCLYYATEIIFRGLEVHAISCRACARPINSKNSFVLKELVKNFFVAQGYGGKGITDAPAAGLYFLQKVFEDKDSHSIKKVVKKYNLD